jgi:ABC-type amino acid transport substrate-binding protein
VIQKGNNFEGYIPDLLDKLATRLGFEYQLRVVADGKYGAKTGGGGWSGMIGEIVSGTAELAAAPLTVSPDRSEAVDFTVPFMSVYKAILMKKQPTSSSSSTDKPIPDIKSIQDLGNQTVVTYGVIKDGTTAEFFKNSPNTLYTRMWTEMSTGDRNVDDSDEGIRRVRETFAGRPYAFILEDAMAEHAISRYPCDLVSIGRQLESRDYALATKKGSELKAQLDGIIRDMKDKGELEALRSKWWTKGECTSSGVAATGLTAAATGLILLLPAVLIPAFVVVGA